MKIRKLLYFKFARHLNTGNSAQGASVPSIIAESTKIKGNILSTGIVHIDGGFDGDIVCNELVIGVKGKVKGNIKSQKLLVYGVFEGTAEVESLFIATNAKLKGDVTHSSIAIEPGAYIEGRCVRKENGTSNVPYTPSKGKKA